MKRQRKKTGTRAPFVTVRGDNGALIDLPDGQACALRKSLESVAEIFRLRRPRGCAPCARRRELSPHRIRGSDISDISDTGFI